MKKSIKLSDIAKLKSLNFAKFKTSQEQPINNKYKQWPNINRNANLRKPDKDLNINCSQVTQQYNFSQRKAKELEKSISSLDLSKKDSSGVFNNVGLSTLMNIEMSVSQILHKRQSDIVRKQTNKSYDSEQQLNKETAIMKQKLQTILSNQLIIPDYLPYNPLSKQLSLPEHEHAQDSYLTSLKQQIMKDKANKFQKIVFKIYAKKFYREIQLFINIHNFINKRQSKIKKNHFEYLKEFVEQQGERKIIMQTIKRKLIQKRKNEVIKRQIQQQLFTHLLSLQI